MPSQRPLLFSLFLLLVATVSAGASGPPDAVTDLAALTGASEGRIDLTWTSPGDDGGTEDLEGFFRIDFSSVTSSFSTSSYRVEIATDAPTGEPQSYTLTGLEPGATYFVNVWGVDEIDLSGDLSNNATAWAQTDVTPPGAVADLGASGNWRRVTLSWTSPGDDGASGALNGQFRVRYSTTAAVTDDASFAAAPFELLIPTSIAAGSPAAVTLTGLSNGVVHYFGVRAEDDFANAGAVAAGAVASAAPVNSAPGAFALASPADGFIATSEPSLLFQWSASADPDAALGDAVTYVFETSTDPAFLSGVQQTAGLGPPLISSATGGLAEDVTNYWRARAVDAEGLSTAAAARRVFKDQVNSAPGSFALSSPADGANVGAAQPLLDWQDAVDPDPGDAVSYRVEYSTAAAFTAFTSSAGLSASQFTVPSALQEDATYYWRVFATDGSSETAASATFLFRVDAAATTPAAFGLVGPADGVRLATTTAPFSWQASSDPDPGDVLSYRITYSFLPNFASSVTVPGLTGTSHSAALGDNLAVYWFVEAVDLLGNARRSNEAQRLFTLDVAKETPGAFALTTPTGSAVVATLRPTLVWTAAADPDPLDVVRYTVEWSDQADLSGAQSAQVADTFLQVPSNLVDDTTYYWRVRAGGYQGTPPVLQDASEISVGTGTFYTSIPNTPPQAFTLLAPADGAAVSTARPAFDWADAGDVDYQEVITYTLQVSTMPDLSGAQVFSGIASSAFTPPSPLRENAAHYWKVTAVDKDGGRTDSNGPFRFTVPTLTRPRAPSGVAGEFSGKALYTVRWNAVAANTDGTPVTDLAGYRIYRALFAEDIADAPPLGFSPAGTNSYEDHTVNGGDFFYLVRAVDSSGIEGPPSLIIESRADAVVVALADDGGLHAVIPFGARRDLAAATNGLGQDLTVLVNRRASEETGPVLRSYALEVHGVDSQEPVPRFRFQSPVEVAFAVTPSDKPGPRLAATAPVSSAGRRSPAPSLPAEQMSVFWFNGVEFVKLGGAYDADRQVVSVLTREPGVYRLQQAFQAGSFELVQLFPNKIFTPNGDGVNDEINFLVNNPKAVPVSGEVFDLHGARVAEMRPGTVGSSLVWDGRDEGGGTVPKGVYLYEIESDGQKLNGTIVVAR